MRHRRSAASFAVLGSFLFFFLLVQAPSALRAAPGPRLERLTQAGKLWGAVRYLHPWLAYKEGLGWDAALVAALPRIGEAGSREEYAAAVQEMLAALGDPATRVIDLQKPDAVPSTPPGDQPGLFRKLEDGVLLVNPAQAAKGMGFAELLQGAEAAGGEILAAEAVVVDLRGGLDTDIEREMLGLVLEEISGAFVSRPCRSPAQRYLLHSGFRPQGGSTSGGYFSGFLSQAADSFMPLPGAAPKRVVFLTDSAIRLPPVALALLAAGDGRIIAEGPLREDSVVDVKTVDLGEGLEARVRVSELVPFPGWPGLAAAVELPQGAGPAALDAALREVRTWPARDAKASTGLAPLPDALVRSDRAYTDKREPDLPWRQFAVIRAWNVIHYFYPYRHLIGDWDTVLPEFLARMDEARTGRDYALTILEMMTHVPDGHTNVFGHPEMEKYFGEAGLPIALRWIEEAPVVTELADEARQAGLAPGDAIVAVDGEPVGARIERLSKYVTASTHASLLTRICRIHLLRGPAGPAVLTVQSPGGPAREVRLTRTARTRSFQAEPAGEVVRILPGDLGYVDLTRLTMAEVDGMFEKVTDTRALIFDMRGYPQGTAWPITPRINTKSARFGAQFRRSQVSAFSGEEEEAGFYFSQPIPKDPRNLPLYTRPIVMLIDDRAISQSEHSGLFFEAAHDIRFIGTATAGANGDITRFSLPGGIRVIFTGHDVRHADGRQLQRVGLQPHVEVAPTRAGIRDGRDEVLERAVQDLEERLANQ